jgi:hypothetical protein
MARMYTTLTNVFGCLAAVLLVLAALAAPTQQARADDPIPCGPRQPCPADYTCVNEGEGPYCVLTPWCLTNPTPCSSGHCLTQGWVCQDAPNTAPCYCDVP